MERREAQGSRAEGPRALGPPPPQVYLGPGILARSVQGSLASSLAPPGAPSPRGEKEKGKDGCRTSLNNRRAERWLMAARHQ